MLDRSVTIQLLQFVHPDGNRDWRATTTRNWAAGSAPSGTPAVTMLARSERFLR